MKIVLTTEEIEEKLLEVLSSEVDFELNAAKWPSYHRPEGIELYFDPKKDQKNEAAEEAD